MDKTAFRSAMGKLRHAKRVLAVNPELRKGIIGGAIGSTLSGGGSYAGMKVDENSKKFKKMSKKKQKVRKIFNRVGIGVNALIGGVYGAQAGADFGSIDKMRRNSKKRQKKWKNDWKDYDFGFGKKRSNNNEARAPHTKDVGIPEWLKGVKTKAEAKQKFREQAKAHHPDRGGSEEKMKKVNTDWDSFQKHRFDKLSFVLPSFLDELKEIYK